MRRPALALLLGCLLLVAGASALDGYGYYQTIEYAGCDQDIYQQDIVIHRTTGDAYNETAGGLETWHIFVGEHCREDYGDVRFVNSTEADLAYYLWPDYTSSSARFAVRLEGAEAAGEVTIWYGAPSAATTSDGDATYGLWCDFLDADEVAAVFDAVGTPDTTYTDSVATITYNAREYYQSKKTFSLPARVEFRMADTTYGTDQYPGAAGFGVRNQGGGGYHVIREAATAAKYGFATCNGGSTSFAGSIGHDLTLQEYQIDWISGTSAALRKNGGVVAAVTSNIPDGPLPATIGRFHYVYSANQMKIDWILVRAYSATPPSVSTFSGEQETVAVLQPFPGLTNIPRDLAGNGLYTDINGNNRLDYNDLTVFFQHLAWAKTTQPTSCFDFNGNGWLDYNDVITLFSTIMEEHI